MRSHKLVTFAAAAAVLATGLAACGNDDDSGSSKTSDGLTVIHTTAVPSTSMLPTRVALVKGFFKQNGLDVQVKNGVDWATFLIQLTKDQLQVSIMPIPIFLAGIQKDQKVLAFSGNLAESNDQPATACAYNPDSGVTDDYTSFVGHRIGVVGLVDSTPDSIKYIVESAGGDPDKINFVAVPPEQQPDQLKAGNVDAACGTMPYPALAEKDGMKITGAPGFEAARISAEKSGDTLTSYPNGMTVTSEKFADENPEALAAWQKSIQDAIDWMDASDANWEEAQQIAADWTGLDLDTIKAVGKPLFFSVYKPEYLDAYVDIGKTVGSITDDLPPSQDMVWENSNP